MAMTAITPDILLKAMTRIRAGETLDVVRRSLGITESRLRYQLDAMFDDFKPRMAANRRHWKELMLPGGEKTPKKPQKKRRGFKFPIKPLEPMTKEQACIQQELREAGRLRLMQDFSREELAVIQVKVAGWISEGIGHRAWEPYRAQSFVETYQF